MFLKLSQGEGGTTGWPVGNCYFNENPVVHLDLDFDLGFVKNKSSYCMQTFYLETLLNNENLSLFYKNEFQNPPSHLRKVSIKQNFALYSGDLFDMIKIIL